MESNYCCADRYIDRLAPNRFRMLGIGRPRECSTRVVTAADLAARRGGAGLQPRIAEPLGNGSGKMPGSSGLARAPLHFSGLFA